jgi:hypothetical protein
MKNDRALRRLQNWKARLTQAVLFTAPFGLWTYAFRSFYRPGQGLILLADARRAFISINYYLNHLLRGVYPMWGPFNTWGRPDDFAVRIIGEVNPFLYVVPLLEACGVPLALAYFIFLVGYFFLGVIGFYCLARAVFGHKRLAYLAMLLLLFSAVGPNIFNDLLVILILVPGIWFFYFGVRFSQTGRPVHFLGLTFTAMLLAVTYIPFMFLTVFVVFACVWVLVYPGLTVRLAKRYLRFAATHKRLVLFAVVSVVLALLPGLLYSQASQSGAYVASWRDPGASQADTINLSLENVDRGAGIIGSLSLKRLFAELDVIPHLGFIYVPVFWFLVATLGLGLRLNRRLVLFFGVSFLLFCISLGGVAPFHRFLFQHLSFVRSFRNIHYFIWFTMCFGILFLAEQVRCLTQLDASDRCPGITGRPGKTWRAAFITLVHAGYGVGLCFLPKVIGATYVVIAVSYMYFLWQTLRQDEKAHSEQGDRGGKGGRLGFWHGLGLIILVAWQPMHVYQTIAYNSRKAGSSYTADPYTLAESVPEFSFQRPHPAYSPARKPTEDFGEVFDTSGFVDEHTYYLGLTDAYRLHERVPQAVLAPYVRHKFWAYTKVSGYAPGRFPWQRFQAALTRQANLAFVEKGMAKPEDTRGAPEPGSTDPLSLFKARQAHSKQSGQAEPITNDDPRLTVEAFDVNYIRFRTRFDHPRFLVYNDSYHDDWQAFRDGQRVPLYKANAAFKGLVVPAGEHAFFLRYRPWWRYALMYGLIVLFFGYAVYLIGAWARRVWQGQGPEPTENGALGEQLQDRPKGGAR